MTTAVGVIISAVIILVLAALVHESSVAVAVALLPSPSLSPSLALSQLPFC